MDIGDFFQLERTLQSDRVVVSASQIKEIACIGERLREFGDFLVVLKNLGYLIRNGLQGLDEFASSGVRDGAQFFRKTHREEEKCSYLRCESLCGGHSYFGPYMSVTS